MKAAADTMDTDEIRTWLINDVLHNDAGKEERVMRLYKALRPLESAEELEGELPPALRYIGPGVWLKAIKDASTV
ncbi:hypothetical protein LJC14_04360 [Treponema sp. OttesenSCG-928-L16]|nr:hypothetical protein [Treponema sp. OttesenSCG-928-L16]